MNNLTKIMIFFIAIVAMTAAGLAQDLENGATGKINNFGTITIVGNNTLSNATGGTIDNDATGTIEFTGATPVFSNEGVITNIINDGIVEFSGALNSTAAVVFAGAVPIAQASTTRLGGTVLYSYDTNPGSQTVLAGYFTDLDLTGAATKDYTTIGIFVYDEYTIAALSGDRDYGTSVFTYDGNNGGVTQTVIAENSTTGADGYYTLELINAAPKSITGLVQVDDGTYNHNSGSGALAIASGGELLLETTAATSAGTNNVTGEITYEGNDGTSTAVFSGVTTVNSGGLISLSGDSGSNATFSGATTVATGGVLTHNTGIGTVAAAVTINGTVNLYAPSAIGDGTDDGTIVTAGVLAIGSTGDFHLGNAGRADLFVRSASGFTNAGDGTNMDFDLASYTHYSGTGTNILGTIPSTGGNDYSYGNLDIDNGGTPLANSAATLATDINVAGDFALAGGDLEMGTTPVLRMLDGTASATYTGIAEVTGHMFREIDAVAATTSAITFNNSATTITLTAGALTLTDLTLNNLPGNITHTGYQSLNDVSRHIGFDYTQTGANDWIATMSYGYLESEVPSGIRGLTGEAKLRYREVLAGATEKVSTGNPPSNTPAGAGDASFGFTSLAGIRSNGGLLSSNVTDVHDLFLRGGATRFISVRHGRWANPATWDEGAEPGSDDIVEIRHTVHAGFTLNDGYTTAEAHQTDMAAAVEIIGAGTTRDALQFDNPSLLFGSGGTGVSGDWNYDNTTTNTGLPTGWFAGDIHLTLPIGSPSITPLTAAQLTTQPTGNSVTYNNGIVIFNGADVSFEGTLDLNSGLEIGPTATLTVGE